MILVIFGISFIGLWVPFLLVQAPNLQDTAGYLNAFSGGIFLTTGLTHVLPDALEMQAEVQGLDNYPLFPLISVITFYGLLMIERVFLHTHGHVPVSIEETHGSTYASRCKPIEMSAVGGEFSDLTPPAGHLALTAPPALQRGSPRGSSWLCRM